MAARKKKEPSRLMKALDFVALAQRDKGAPYQTHARFKNGTLVAFDGVLAAGCAVEETLDCCPHTHNMLHALKRCDGVLSLTQTATGVISVRAGKFAAMIPCVTSDNLPEIAPDTPCGALTEAFRAALSVVDPFVLEGAQRVVLASVYLRNGTVLATNGHLILEVWHGINMPEGLLLPKSFVSCLKKVQKELHSFGFSDRTFTVYFTDGSWLRTQLYIDTWPDCDSILNQPHNATALPAEFFTALESVFPFIEDNRLRLSQGLICSHRDVNSGAAYEVHGLNVATAINAKDIKMLDGLIDRADLSGERVIHFYGKNLRGAFSVVRD